MSVVPIKQETAIITLHTCLEVSLPIQGRSPGTHPHSKFCLALVRTNNEQVSDFPAEF